MIDALIQRFFQANTLRGVIQLGGSLGLFHISPTMESAIIAAVMGAVGLINVIVDERKAARKVATIAAARVVEQVVGAQPLPWLDDAAKQPPLS